jgi:hypothetical protein
MAHKRDRPRKTEALRFRLEEAEINRLSLIARSEGMSMAAVLRRWIRSAKIRNPVDPVDA